MIQFQWRRDNGNGAYKRYGVTWELLHNDKIIGRCVWLSGSKHYRLAASAPVKGGVILTEYYAGTAAAARARLERDWCKRSIGLFGEDDINFATGVDKGECRE